MPNVIVVMVDDQSLASFNRMTMPRTFDLLDGGKGRELEGYASPPLCCPSRAGFMTGQYPQNHGVFENNWALLREPANTLPSWLQAAGYKTAFAGKFLNKHAEYPKPAAGFDYWFGLQGPPAYFDYEASRQGVEVSYGSKRSDYSTTVVNEESERFIRRAANGDDPFFLWSSYFAPHARRSESSFCGTKAPLPLEEDFKAAKKIPLELSPSFNERDVSDKPQSVKQRELIDRKGTQEMKNRFRCTVAALQEVDRGVGGFRRLLAQEKLADDTIIFYTSDNGYFFGEHRLLKGKVLPYREAVQVPFLAHVPPRYLDGEEMASVSQPVANIDLAPTILDFANAGPCTEDGTCRVMDGRSMTPLFRGEEGAWPNPRPIGFQLGEGCRTYQAVYEGDESYVEWPVRRANGSCGVAERELYDLQADPFQLRNRLYKPSPGAIADAERLSESLSRVSTCAGIEGRDPQQGGRPFC